MSSSALYRPPQWQSASVNKVIISFPGTGTVSQYSSAAGSTAVLPLGQTYYAFDAEIQIDHEQEIRKTEHPVQTGSSISDHAFVVPARLIIDVLMSDAVAIYYTNSWSGSPSKSISTYQTLLAMAYARIPMTITTRLRTYTNMIIESLPAEETMKTFTGLRTRVTFGEIFITDVTAVVVSARPQDTNKTQTGSVNTQPTTTAQQSQNNINTATVPIPPTNAIGAGPWSSVNTSNLDNFFGLGK